MFQSRKCPWRFNLIFFSFQVKWEGLGLDKPCFYLPYHVRKYFSLSCFPVSSFCSLLLTSSFNVVTVANAFFLFYVQKKSACFRLFQYCAIKLCKLFNNRTFLCFLSVQMTSPSKKKKKNINMPKLNWLNCHFCFFSYLKLVKILCFTKLIMFLVRIIALTVSCWFRGT